MSPVERTAAWVLNNGQYEDEEEETATQNKEEPKPAEKVSLWINGSWGLSVYSLSLSCLPVV